MKIKNSFSTILRINRNEIISLFLIIFFILLSIGGSGCLVENKPGQSPTNIPVTWVVNNSPVPTSNVPTPIPTIIDPSEQSDIQIFKSAESICIGETLTYGLINKGNSTIEFPAGDAYLIQFYNNGTWGDIFLGGGTQAFWALTPGMKYKRSRVFTNEYSTGLSEFYNKSHGLPEFTIRPGLYRITFLGENVDTNEVFNLSTEFSIREC